MAESPKTPGGSSYGFKFAWEIIPTVDRVKLNNVIKSQDEILASVKKINEAMKETGKTTNFVWGLERFEIYRRTFDYAVKKIAEVNKLYTELYYLDRRMGTTGGLAIAGFQNFAYAAQQIGLTKQAGLNLIESYGAATRTNPGVASLVGRLAPSALGKSGEPQEDILAIVGDLKKKYGEKGYFIAALLAQNFGIEEAQFRNLYENYEDISKAYQEHKQKLKDLNINTEQVSRNAVELSREWHKLTDTTSLYETKLSDWISRNILTPVLKDVNTNMNLEGKRLTTPLGKEGGLSNYYSQGPLDILYNWWSGVKSGAGSGIGLRGTISPFTPSGNVQQDAIKRLMGMGLPYNSAVGAMVGLTGESGDNLNPHSFNPTKGGKGAYGIANWRAERQTAFEKMFGHSIFNSKAEEQWQFMLWELQGGDKDAARAFKKLQNPNLTAGQATGIWEELFERHGDAAYTATLSKQADAYAAKNPTVNIDHDQNITVNIQGNADKDTVQRMGTILKPNLDNMSDQMKMSVRGNNFR
jgi:Phage tail lysozyme